jgi:hypothetical protein
MSVKFLFRWKVSGVRSSLFSLSDLNSKNQRSNSCLPSLPGLGTAAALRPYASSFNSSRC